MISKKLGRKLTFLIGVSMLAMSGGAYADDLDSLIATEQGTSTSAEYNVDYSKAQINAAGAYARGLSGAGETIAVLDSGVNLSNPDLAGQILPGYDALTGGTVTGDAAGHGTFVAGIIAADANGSGSEGVAFNSKIFPVQIINSTGAMAATDYQLGYGMAVAAANNVSIYNNSWNTTTAVTALNAASIQAYYPVSLSIWEYLVSKGSVFVFAAGNSSATQPGAFAGLPYYFPQLKTGWLSVVATDSTGALASYSNQCGVTAAYCLAAPGTNIYSTYGTGLGVGSGTSFAAPMVSASIAILMQEFPGLTAAQAAQILLVTATKTGIYANQQIYGQGLLNLTAATQPVGQVMIPGGSKVADVQIALAKTATIGSKSMSQSWVKNVGPILVVDSFDRGYTVDSSAMIQTPTHTFDSQGATQQFGFGQMQEISPGVYGFSVTNQFSGEQLGRFALNSKDGASLEGSIGTDPAYGFGSFGSGTLPAGALIDPDGAGNPYLNLADQAGAVHVAMPVDTTVGRLKISASMFNGYAQTADLDAQLTDPSYTPPSVTGGAIEVAAPIDAIDGTVSFNAGGVDESGRILGSSSSGAFGSTNSTMTYFEGINAEMKVAKNFSFVGGYEMGQSSVSQSASAFNTQYGTLNSQSFHVGMVADQVFDARDKMGFVVSQPIRVSSGNVNVTVPTQRDYFGNILSSNENLSAADTGHELDLQGFYSLHQSNSTSFDAGVMVRLTPDNVAGAQSETIGLLRVTNKF